jgi:superfamily II DNA or RNA helicase
MADPPQAPILRPYQEADLARIRAAFANGACRVCYQAPTGSGKTVLFAAVVAGATARGNRTVILGHRGEIVQQVDAALDALGVTHGIIAAGYPEIPELLVQVASVATLVRRLDKLAPPNLIVPDECHHAAAPSWRRILDAYPNRVLRPAPDKNRALILDHADNTRRFGPADIKREWALAGEASSESCPLQRCDCCGALIPLGCVSCPECGAPLREPPAPAAPRMHVERRGGALVELSRLGAMSYPHALRWAGPDEQRLRLVAKARGYKPGWVWHRLQELRGVGR